MSTSASGAKTTANGTAKSREHSQGNQDRKYTIEQKTAVIRVRRCSPTAFYEILSLEKTAGDSEIKKAYRRLSLLTHPDKNGYEGADEAFKSMRVARRSMFATSKRSGCTLTYDQWFRAHFRYCQMPTRKGNMTNLEVIQTVGFQAVVEVEEPVLLSVASHARPEEDRCMKTRFHLKSCSTGSLAAVAVWVVAFPLVRLHTSPMNADFAYVHN